MLQRIDYAGKPIGNIDFIEARWDRNWSEAGDSMVYLALAEYNRLNALGIKYVKNVGRPETGVFQKLQYDKEQEGAFATISGILSEKPQEFGQ